MRFHGISVWAELEFLRVKANAILDELSAAVTRPSMDYISSANYSILSHSTHFQYAGSQVPSAITFMSQVCQVEP